MSLTTPIPPTNDQLSELTGNNISHRELIRETSLSVVERLHFSSGSPATAVLKTTGPELRHETAVQRFVSEFPVAATSLIAADDRSDSPWLLFHDIGASPVFHSRQPPTDDIGFALEMMAEVHAQSATWSDLENVVPDRSIPVLENKVLPLVKDALRTVGEKFDDALEAPFAEGMSRARTELIDLPTTLVHGDFDPGNLAYSRGQWRALDWGLSHRNVPLVDVAHMVMRFDEETRTVLTNRYLRAMKEAALDLPGTDTPGPANRLLEAANIAHMAFFVWWHSHCISTYGSAFESTAGTIKSRIDQVAKYGDELGTKIPAEIDD